jgi:uncharacterized protein (DUF433 family)
MDYRDRIAIDPEIRFGKPCVRGTRITVGDLLAYLASGMTEQQVLADFPQLTSEDIRACLAFAAERERRVVFPPAEQQMLLFDENLAERLVPALADLYPDCVHVHNRRLASAADRAVWQHAQDQGLIIVTEDEDFQQLCVLHGPPPK